MSTFPCVAAVNAGTTATGTTNNVPREEGNYWHGAGPGRYYYAVAITIGTPFVIGIERGVRERGERVGEWERGG